MIVADCKELIKTQFTFLGWIFTAMDKDDVIQDNIVAAAQLIKEAFNRGDKLFLCGNGGSAADALHIAAEFVGRYGGQDDALPAIALTSPSNITAIANDYVYADVFARQVQALGQKGDVLIGITTSGASLNIINAIDTANEKGMITVLLTGQAETLLHTLPAQRYADISICVPCRNTQHIQTAHIAIGHILCDLVHRKEKTWGFLT